MCIFLPRQGHISLTHPNKSRQFSVSLSSIFFFLTYVKGKKRDCFCAGFTGCDTWLPAADGKQFNNSHIQCHNSQVLEWRGLCQFKISHLCLRHSLATLFTILFQWFNEFISSFQRFHHYKSTRLDVVKLDSECLIKLFARYLWRLIWQKKQLLFAISFICFNLSKSASVLIALEFFHDYALR